MANLQQSFIRTLVNSPQDPIDPTKKYQCTNCYRAELDPKFVALISHGEAYCRGCIKEVI